MYAMWKSIRGDFLPRGMKNSQLYKKLLLKPTEQFSIYSARNVSNSRFKLSLNEALKDYRVPVKISPAQLEPHKMIAPGGFDADRSVLECLIEEAMEEFPQGLRVDMQNMIGQLTPDHPLANTASLVPAGFKILSPDAYKEQIQQAEVLGWIYQMYQAYTILLDDFADDGETRYGKPTWAKIRNFDKPILNFEIQMLNCLIFKLLRARFGHLGETYSQIVALFHNCAFEAWIGNRMEVDLVFEKLRTGDTSEENFSMETYRSISQLKCGSVHFYLPVALSMILSGMDLKRDTKRFSLAKDICFQTGYICQVVDDYLDCYPPFNSKNVDSVDTDILRGQLTWVVLTAKELLSKDDWAELKTIYGTKSKMNLRRVKALYGKLDFKDLLLKCIGTETKEIYERLECHEIQNWKESKVLLRWMEDMLLRFLS